MADDREGGFNHNAHNRENRHDRGGHNAHRNNGENRHDRGNGDRHNQGRGDQRNEKERDELIEVLTRARDAVVVRIPSTNAPVEADVKPYSAQEFNDKRDSVSRAKSLMDPVQHLGAFKKFMAVIDLYKPLTSRLMNEPICAEHVTNAWIKMRELDGMFSFSSPMPKLLFFNAEFPGSFILSFNHIFATKVADKTIASNAKSPTTENFAEIDRKMNEITKQALNINPANPFKLVDEADSGQISGGRSKNISARGTGGANHPVLNWVASSLAPDAGESVGTSVLDDKYGMYQKNAGRWLMQIGDSKEIRDEAIRVAKEIGIGAPSFANPGTEKFRNNGDATNADNLIDYERRLDHRVEFYSHDAGIDVSGDYNKQEEQNARLHFGCFIAALLTLAKGGNVVAKQYSFFETFTWNLIIIYADLFEKFYVVKPKTSRGTNSETYLVGIGFKGEFPHRDMFLERLRNFNMRPFIPKDAISVVCASAILSLRQANREIFDRQETLIRAAMKLFSMARYDQMILPKIEETRRFHCDLWLRENPVKNLNKRFNLS